MRLRHSSCYRKTFLWLFHFFNSDSLRQELSVLPEPAGKRNHRNNPQNNVVFYNKHVIKMLLFHLILRFWSSGPSSWCWISRHLSDSSFSPFPYVHESCWYDDVIKWNHFPRYWPFVRGIHRSPVNSPYKGQWREAFMLSLICARINGWVNNRKAGDLRRHRAHYDAIVMEFAEHGNMTAEFCTRHRKRK